MLDLTQKKSNFLLVHSAFFVLALSAFFNVKFSLFLLAGLLFLFVAMSKPWLSLALFIIVVPLSNIALLNHRIGNMPGLELSNLFLACAVLMCLASRENFKLSITEALMVFLVLLIHGLSFLRSLPHLSHINWYFGTNMGDLKYIISYFIKPTLYFLPFLLILAYIRGREKILFFYKIIVFSLFIASLVVLGVYFFDTPNKTEWSYVRSAIGSFLGFHSNDIAIFYVVGYPFVLVHYIYKRGLYPAASLFLTLASVALLYSRTAYVLIIFSTVVLFFIEKRKKWVLVFSAGVIIFLLFSATTVKERFMVGLEEQDIAAISAGRVNQIWPTVFQTLEKDPLAIVYGKGRYSIIYAAPLEKGHPHNMYLEALLDSGVLGLSVFLAFYFFVLSKIREGVATANDDEMKLVLKASLVSIFVYLISGVTGRHFFPHITNSYLWIIMALGMTAAKLDRSACPGASPTAQKSEACLLNEEENSCVLH